MIHVKEIITNSINELNINHEITDNSNLNTIIDSMDLVNIIIKVEEAIFENYDKHITILNEKFFSEQNNPFKNINSATEYVNKLLQE